MVACLGLQDTVSTQGFGLASAGCWINGCLTCGSQQRSVQQALPVYFLQTCYACNACKQSRSRTCALCRNLLRLAFFSAGVRLASTSADCCCVPAADEVQQRQASPCSPCSKEEATEADVSRGDGGPEGMHRTQQKECGHTQQARLLDPTLALPARRPRAEHPRS